MKKEDLHENKVLDEKQCWEFLEELGHKSQCGLYRRYEPKIESLNKFNLSTPDVSIDFHIDGVMNLDDDILDEIDTIFLSVIDQLKPLIREVNKRILKRAYVALDEERKNK